MQTAKHTAAGTLPRLLAALTLLLVFFIFTRTAQDADMWWHLRAGKEMFEHKAILLTDQFSYTRSGEPWTNAFWLAELLFYALFRVGGFFALSLFTGLVGAATFLMIYRRLPGRPLLNVAIVVLAALTAAPIWGPRPQIISFFLVAWLDGWLDDRQRGLQRPLWILAPVFALWANLHGGWIWGILLLLAHLSGAVIQAAIDGKAAEAPPLRRDAGALLLWTTIAALAVGINPNGLALWKLPFHTVDVSLQIQEWLSPDFHRLDFHPFLWMLFALVIAARFSPPVRDWPALLKVIGFAYLTFVAQRNIAPFAIVAAPVLADWTAGALDAQVPARTASQASPWNRPLPQWLKTAVNVILLGSLAALALGRAYWLSLPAQVNDGVPAGAVDWIKRNQPQGRLFNSYNWGGYLTWELPGYPVFIDGRADLYGNEMISVWREIVSGSDDGLALLDEWDVRVVLLEPGWPVLNRLSQQGWEPAYRDEQSVIYTR